MNYHFQIPSYTFIVLHTDDAECGDDWVDGEYGWNRGGGVASIWGSGDADGTVELGKLIGFELVDM